MIGLKLNTSTNCLQTTKIGNSLVIYEIISIVNKEAIIMIITETWWEAIFSGPLSIGINEKKMVELEDELFLYFIEQQLPKEEHTS